MLDEAGAASVVFVPTDYIGGTNTFDEGEEPDEPICAWEDLATLAQHRVSIHRTGCTTWPCRNSMRMRSVSSSNSRAAPWRHGGATVDLFAFPYGDTGTDAHAMAGNVQAAGYHAAFGYGGGPADLHHDDRYRLPRLAMGPDTDLAELLT